MMVAVLSSTGIKLMPTTCYKTRKLLKKGRAVIYQYRPFTIKLTQRENGDTQPIEYCCDTGYQHIGISIKSENHEYVGAQVDMLSDEKQRHQFQKTYKRTRRNRLRYREPRFDNRTSTKPKGWLAPSIEHKKQIHLAWLKKYMAVMPITSITFEMGEFDTQVLKALEEGKTVPVGVDYQRGEQYGLDDLRDAVFERDHHTCCICGKSIDDGAILALHHLKYRSMGGTNRMGNLITVCTDCHTPENHQPGGALYGLVKTFKVPEFKGATFMTSVRWQMYDAIKEAYPDAELHVTYGSNTKRSRRKLNVRKTHINDAYCMGIFHPRHRTEHYLYKKKRRNNRVLSKFYDAKYIDARDGKKKTGQQLFNGRTNRNHNRDTENLHQYRKQKVSKGRTSTRKQHYPIQPGDIVIYKGKKYVTKGCHCNGTRIMCNGKSVAIKNIKIHRYAGGYIAERLERKVEYTQA